MKQSVKWRIRRALYFLGLWNAVERLRLLGRLALRRPHDNDFRFFAPLAKENTLFLDVGANIGQSAVSIRAVGSRCQILSLEPNPFLSKELAFLASFLGGFSFRSVAVGNIDETREFYVPRADGVPFTQEATFDRSLLEHDQVTRLRILSEAGVDEFVIETVPMKIVPVDSLGVAPDFVKLDVQGYELPALEGMERTLSVARPILMIENCLERDAITRHLLKHGYRGPLFFDPKVRQLAKFDDSSYAWNIFYVPEHKIAELRRLNLIAN